jgi:glyoxylate reductase
MKPSILITRSFFPELLEQLRPLYDLMVWEKDSPPEKKWLLQHIGAADALICMLTDKIDQEVIAHGAAGRLKVVSQMAVGFDNIDVQSASQLKIPVGNTPGVLTETTADFAWALLMAIARQVITSQNEVQRGLWRPWGPEVFAGADVYGKTLGVIGYGRIGQAVARRATGFGMNVLVYSPGKTATDSDKVNPEFTNLEDLLRRSDFVTLHANLNERSRGLIGSNELALMKPGAFLINTARGAMLDHNALYKALKAQKLAGAALDVFDPEPIPHNHPLLSLPNVIITPHIASASLSTRRRMAEMTIENALAGLAGTRLPYCVNPEVYGGQ